MGCDIHIYREKRVNGAWVTADRWEEYDYGDGEKGIEVPWQESFTDRNYNLFGLLSAGVRSEYAFSFTARGIPFNACKEVAECSARWGVDGHSHSYLYLHELKDMREYLNSATIIISGMKDAKELALLKESIESGNPDYGLLYPYCKWSSRSDYVEFDIEVPAALIIGGGLDKIISTFDDVDGDNHRIVFFFDN